MLFRSVVYLCLPPLCLDTSYIAKAVELHCYVGSEIASYMRASAEYIVLALYLIPVAYLLGDITHCIAFEQNNRIGIAGTSQPTFFVQKGLLGAVVVINLCNTSVRVVFILRITFAGTLYLGYPSRIIAFVTASKTVEPFFFDYVASAVEFERISFACLVRYPAELPLGIVMVSYRSRTVAAAY